MIRDTQRYSRRLRFELAYYGKGFTIDVNALHPDELVDYHGMMVEQHKREEARRK